MKVREPVARPLDVIAAELLLTISQAFVVGALLYLAVGVWDERGVASGSVAAILVALAFAVGAAWAYWLLGGSGLPLAAAELPVALFLAFAGLLGLRGEELLRIAPLALLSLLAASIYGIVAGVFLDSPRRLRWDQRRASRRQGPAPRISPTTAAWAARARTLRRRSSGGTSAPSGERGAGTARPPASAPLAATAPEPAAAPPPTPPGGPSGPETSGSAPTVTAPEVPARPTTRRSPPSRSGGPARPAAGTVPPPPPPPEPVELPTSVEPRAQRSPWAWARPPEWIRDEDEFEADRDGDRP